MLIEYLLLAAASVFIINGVMEWRVLTKENASLKQKIVGLTLPLWLPLALLLLAWYLESCGIICAFERSTPLERFFYRNSRRKCSKCYRIPA